MAIDPPDASDSDEEDSSSETDSEVSTAFPSHWSETSAEAANSPQRGEREVFRIGQGPCDHVQGLQEPFDADSMPGHLGWEEVPMDFKIADLFQFEERLSWTSDASTADSVSLMQRSRSRSRDSPPEATDMRHSTDEGGLHQEDDSSESMEESDEELEPWKLVYTNMTHDPPPVMASDAGPSAADGTSQSTGDPITFPHGSLVEGNLMAIDPPDATDSDDEDSSSETDSEVSTAFPSHWSESSAEAANSPQRGEREVLRIGQGPCDHVQGLQEPFDADSMPGHLGWEEVPMDFKIADLFQFEERLSWTSDASTADSVSLMQRSRSRSRDSPPEATDMRHSTDEGGLHQEDDSSESMEESDEELEPWKLVYTNMTHDPPPVMASDAGPSIAQATSALAFPQGAIRDVHVVDSLSSGHFGRVALVECVDDRLDRDNEAMVLFDVMVEDHRPLTPAEANENLFHSLMITHRSTCLATIASALRLTSIFRAHPEHLRMMHNNEEWPLRDSSHRILANGDHLQLQFGPAQSEPYRSDLRDWLRDEGVTPPQHLLSAPQRTISPTVPFAAEEPSSSGLVNRCAPSQTGGDTLILNSCFIAHTSSQTCKDSRVLFLPVNPAEWRSAVTRVWADRFKAGHPFTISFIVPPPPPVGIPAFDSLPHVIVEQEHQNGRIGMLVSTQWKTVEPHMTLQQAYSAGARHPLPVILDMIELTEDCAKDFHCEVYREGQRVVDGDIYPRPTGQSIVVVIKHAHDSSSTDRDTVSMMQLPPASQQLDSASTAAAATGETHTTARSPSPEPSTGETPAMCLSDTDTAALDLLQARISLVHVERTHPPPKFEVMTYFLSLRRLPTCLFGRVVEIDTNPLSWKQVIVQAWQGMVDPASQTSLYIVSPQPMANAGQDHYVAYALLVQHEHPDLSAALYTQVEDQEHLHVALFLPSVITHRQILHRVGLGPRPSRRLAFEDLRAHIAGASGCIRRCPLERHWIHFAHSPQTVLIALPQSSPDNEAVDLIVAPLQKQPDDELEVMRLIAKAGQSKAVVIDFVQEDNVTWALYVLHSSVNVLQEGTSRNPSPWPEPQHTHDLGPLWQTQSLFGGESEPRFRVETGLSRDLVASLLTQDSFPVSQDLSFFEGDFIDQASAQPTMDIHRLDASCLDRLVIFTDGSASQAGDRAAWAFVVLGERYGQTPFLVGWRAGLVCVDPASPKYAFSQRLNSANAEREALTWALWWRLSMNGDWPTMFCSDSVTTKDHARGAISSSPHDIGNSQLRALYQALSLNCGDQAVDISHCRAHAGMLWNEVADTIAAQITSEQAESLNGTFDYRVWQDIVPHLWCLVRPHFDMPHLALGGFNVPPPNLPQLSSECKEPAAAPARTEITAHLDMTFATANVQTLYQSPEGCAGKIDFLQAQFASYGLLFIGHCHDYATLPELELTVGEHDHTVAVAHVTHRKVLQHLEMPARQQPIDRQLIARAHRLEEDLRQGPIQAWGQDIETQTAALNEHLMSSLRKHCPKAQSQPKKPYICPVTWDIRTQLRRARQHLRTRGGLTGRSDLKAYFRAWIAAARHQDLLHGPDLLREVLRVGSRPGDSYADIVFGLLFGHMLHQLHGILRTEGLVTQIPAIEEPGLWSGPSDQAEELLGIGSTEEQHLVDQHDGLLPSLQAAGPHLPGDPARDDFADFNTEFEDALMAFLTDAHENALTIQDVETFVKEYPSTHTLSWRDLETTLQHFRGHYGPEEELMVGLASLDMQACLDRLLDPSTWTWEAGTPSEVVQCVGTVDYWHATLALPEAAEAMAQLCPCPRPLGAHRVCLHLFAGRRRPGDLQFYMDRWPSVDGVVMHVVSLDVIYDKAWGDLSRAETRLFWLRSIEEMWVLAVVSGPPCETWSRARAVELEDHRQGPRPVRSAKHPWGLQCLTLRELRQVSLGNLLLSFSLEAATAILAANGIAAVEHPAEPDDPALPSIWRLPVVQLLRAHSSVQLVRFYQGHFGAVSPKPTMLLTINIPDMAEQLWDHRLRASLPEFSSIGKAANGSFLTSPLKEYPPGLCKALAGAISVRAGRTTQGCAVQPADFWDRISTMQVEYGRQLGPDCAD
eukprot:Skav210904  [mRNA]  locus=scaffold2900:288060:297488:- [translate_table: standard]